MRVETTFEDVECFHQDFAAILIRIGNLAGHWHEGSLVGNYIFLFSTDQSKEIVVVIQEGVVQDLYTGKVPALGPLNIHMIQELVVIS